MPADSRVTLPAASGRIVLSSGSASAYPADAGPTLLRLARTAISSQLGLAAPDAGTAPQWLVQQGACFVTLTLDAKLRGCIGTLRAHRALAEDARANALGAAFRDPRFKPLTAAEFPGIAVEISVLSPLEPLAFGDEPEALRQLRPGVDGLVFEYGHHSSTFLPQVWADMREPADFLAHLKYKAGLPPDFWDPAVRLSRYTVQKWREDTGG